MRSWQQTLAIQVLTLSGPITISIFRRARSAAGSGCYQRPLESSYSGWADQAKCHHHGKSHRHLGWRVKKVVMVGDNADRYSAGIDNGIPTLLVDGFTPAKEEGASAYPTDACLVSLAEWTSMRDKLRFSASVLCLLAATILLTIYLAGCDGDFLLQLAG